MPDEKAMPRDVTADASHGNAKAKTPKDDAKGQSEGSHAGVTNDGVTSANPRTVTGNKSGDATFPLKK